MAYDCERLREPSLGVGCRCDPGLLRARPLSAAMWLFDGATMVCQ